MHSANSLRYWLIPLLFGLIVVARVAPMQATTFDWTRPNGCGLFSCSFLDANNWTPSGGPPGTGDVAFIDMNGTTHLTGNTGQLDNLTIEGSTLFRTFGHRLSVTGTPGNLFMFGAGFNGSTVLRVDQGSGFEVIADTVSLHQGAEVNLQGGGVTATFRMLTSRSSLISGNGLIGLVGNNVGTSIIHAGTIRPSGGDITIVTPNSAHDLDGNIAGVEPGRLDITSSGSLIVNGEQFEPFSGQLDIGGGRSLTLDSEWQMDGELNFTTPGFNRLIAPDIKFLSGANVQTNGSAGRIEGDSVWSNGSSANLRLSSDVLVLNGNSQISGGATFGGLGRLLNVLGSRLSLGEGATIGVELSNQGALELSTATVEDFVQTTTGSLNVDLGGTGSGEFDALQILEDSQLAGSLNVSLANGFSLAGGQEFKILEVDGNSSGQFDGFAEGATVGTFGEELFITYQGGDGNDVVLYTIGLPGDFNGDGDVDGTDFLVWQRTDGSSAGLAQWQNNYGATAPLMTNATAVPEPTAITLLLSAAAVLIGQRSNF